MTALVIAAIKNYEEVVDVLLKAGANPDIQSHVCCNKICLHINYYSHNISCNLYRKGLLRLWRPLNVVIRIL